MGLTTRELYRSEPYDRIRPSGEPGERDQQSEACERNPSGEACERNQSGREPRERDQRESPQWYALTVRHQHERPVDRVLCAGGIETFLPLFRARRRWSDRVKELETPLFPGYVFGRFPFRDRVRVL